MVGIKNCLEPPLQELVPEGGHHSPRPPQRPNLHGSRSLVAAGGISRRANIRRAGTPSARFHHRFLRVQEGA
jgi:hypothetical protein